jgi:hypothetical protein
MIDDDINLYINFVLNAILGKLAEADAIMRLKPGAIEGVAAFLVHKYPIERKPLYRGVLLDPQKPYELDPRLTFMSWSEDHDVAAWFASPTSIISEDAFENNPRLHGFMITLESHKQCERVLWHHSWSPLFHDPSLDQLALIHPFMGIEGQRQVAWSLRTQREVITAPVFRAPEAFYASNVDELDLKFAPPWIIEELERAS